MAMLLIAQPNLSHIVVQVANGRNLSTEAAQHAFADDVVCELHRLDPRWGHLRKTGGQTQVHGHAEDAALYLSDTPGQSVAVDFVAGARTPNARPWWNPDVPRYSASDWVSPVGHNGCLAGDAPSPVPTPPAPTVDLGAITSRLDALAAEVSALRLAVASVGESLTQIGTRLTALEARPFPSYSGKVLGFAVTLRPNTP